MLPWGALDFCMVILFVIPQSVFSRSAKYHRLVNTYCRAQRYHLIKGADNQYCRHQSNQGGRAVGLSWSVAYRTTEWLIHCNYKTLFLLQPCKSWNALPNNPLLRILTCSAKQCKNCSPKKGWKILFGVSSWRKKRMSCLQLYADL